MHGAIRRRQPGDGGGDYTLNEHVSVSLFSSRLKDVWNQYYADASLGWPLSDELAMIGGFNYYKAVDEGQQRLGAFDNDKRCVHAPRCRRQPADRPEALGA